MSEQRYTLAILFGVFAVAQLDRQILSISLDAIGREFSLTNTELGLLSGLAFAVVFVLFGFPVARLAARGNRRDIIAVSALFWSVMTIVTSAAQSFTHLIAARLGVGIGEAGSVAPAHSVISDLYPPEKRTSAMATFASGANVGVLFAFLIGGLVGQAWGWRWAFVCAGIPGIVLAALLRLTTSDPPRASPVAFDFGRRSLLVETLKAIWHDKGLFHAMFGLGLTGIVTFGALAWTPAFIIRSHGLNPAQAGIFLALAVGVGGGLGTYLTGQLADQLGKSDPRWRIGLVVCAILLAKPFAFGFLLLPDTQVALALFLGSSFFAAAFWGPTFAFLHSRLPSEMRPMATAIFLFAFNLIGVGIGPTLVGLASETIFAGFGLRSLSLAMAAMHLVGLWGAAHYWIVVRQIAAPAMPLPK